MQSRVIVVDTGALLRLQRLPVSARLMCPPSVLSEVRDRATLESLASLGIQPEVAAVDAEDVAQTKAFAQLFGESGALSQTDVDVVALARGWMRQHLPAAQLNTTPKLTLKQLTAADLQSIGLLSPCREAVEPFGDAGDAGDALNAGGAGDAGPASGEAPEEDDEIGWTTADNFDSLAETTQNVNADDAAPLLSVMSTDYAVQNVCMQMGIPVTNVKGYQLRNVRLRLLVCRTCKIPELDSTAKFCKQCALDNLQSVPLFSAAGGGFSLPPNWQWRYPCKKQWIHDVPRHKVNKHDFGYIHAPDQWNDPRIQRMIKTAASQQQKKFNEAMLFEDDLSWASVSTALKSATAPSGSVAKVRGGMTPAGPVRRRRQPQKHRA